MKETYFAAQNSGEGFLNYFPQIFFGYERIYILKGGPGTGKSYFLSAIADMAAARGMACICYLCSSDPDSLDGVCLPELGIAVLDGTSPHNVEPALVGAREEIVNLGQFWDAGQLKARRQEIEMQSECKKQHYAAALGYLNLAGRMKKQQLSIVKPYVDEKKLTAAALRFVKKRGRGNGVVSIAALDSYGMKGKRCLPTLSDNAREILGLCPCQGIELMLGKAMLDACRSFGVEVRYSPHPLLPQYPEMLYFQEEELLVTLGEGKKQIGTRRFLKNSIASERKLLCFLKKSEHTLADAAMKEFEKMKTAHFSLENIYGKAMNFDEKQAFSEKFLHSLFDR